MAVGVWKIFLLTENFHPNERNLGLENFGAKLNFEHPSKGPFILLEIWLSAENYDFFLFDTFNARRTPLCARGIGGSERDGRLGGKG